MDKNKILPIICNHELDFPTGTNIEDQNLSLTIHLQYYLMGKEKIAMRDDIF